MILLQHLLKRFVEKGRLTVIAHDGTHFDMDAENGSTVMENAIRHAVPGLEAECGGGCSCETCHVYWY